MPVNHADGTLFGSILFYPVVAVVGAWQAGARWLVVLFLPLGMLIGMPFIWLGRRLIYFFMGRALRMGEKISPPWLQGIIFTPFFLFYIIAPYLVVFAGLWLTWSLSTWIVRHV